VGFNIPAALKASWLRWGQEGAMMVVTRGQAMTLTNVSATKCCVRLLVVLVMGALSADDAVLKDPPRQAETLRAMLPKAANGQKDVVVMPHLNHALRVSTTRIHGESYETLNPAALKTIVDWVSAVTENQ
jgi:hypothetical protein